jgi:hypothetical protein
MAEVLQISLVVNAVAFPIASLTKITTTLTKYLAKNC